MKSHLSFELVAILFVLVGCQSQHPMGDSPPRHYLDVDYAQLVAPGAVEQFSGKQVRVRAAFFRMQQAALPQVYSPQESVAVETVAPGGTLHGQVPTSPIMLTVIAPRAFGALFPTLTFGDTLLIEGLAVTSGSHLVIEADTVQKVF